MNSFIVGVLVVGYFVILPLIILGLRQNGFSEGMIATLFGVVMWGYILTNTR